MRTTEGGPHAKQQNAGKTRQKTMTLLIPVLAVTLVALVRKPAGTPQSAPADVIDSPTTAVHETNDVGIDWQRPALYQPGRSDPMRLETPTYVTEHGVAPQIDVRRTLALRGVLYSTDKPAAIIGTSLVHEGEQVAGVTVVKIEKNGVVFEIDGEQWKQTVSAPTNQPDPDTKENRTRPAGPEGNNNDLS